MKFLTVNIFRKDDQLFLKITETDVFLQRLSPSIRSFLKIRTLPQVLIADFGYDPVKILCESEKPVIFVASNDCDEGKAKSELYICTITTYPIPRSIHQINDLFNALGSYVYNGKFRHCQISEKSVIDDLELIDNVTVKAQVNEFPEYKGHGKFYFDHYVQAAQVQEKDPARKLATPLAKYLTAYQACTSVTADIISREIIQQFLLLSTELQNVHFYEQIRNALTSSLEYANKHSQAIYNCTNQYVQFKSKTKVDTILLNPKTSAAQKLDYLLELEKLTGEFNYNLLDFFKHLYEESFHKLYAACIGQLDPNKHEYGDGHSEYRFLKHAQFQFLPDGRLCIKVKNNPIFVKEYTVEGVAQLSKELQHMAKFIGFEFDTDANFGDVITFTPKCTSELMDKGLHLNANYYYENKPKQYGTFFSQATCVNRHPNGATDRHLMEPA